MCNKCMVLVSASVSHSLSAISQVMKIAAITPTAIKHTAHGMLGPLLCGLSKLTC